MDCRPPAPAAPNGTLASAPPNGTQPSAPYVPTQPRVHYLAAARRRSAGSDASLSASTKGVQLAAKSAVSTSPTDERTAQRKGQETLQDGEDREDS